MNATRLTALILFTSSLVGCFSEGTGDTADSGQANTDTANNPQLEGCPGTDGGGVWSSEPCISEVSYDCGTTTPGAWTYSVRTLRWAEGGASINIYETSAWEEGADESNMAARAERGHVFSQGQEPGVDYDANGEWDLWGLALMVTEEPSEVDPGTTLNTAFSCELYAPETGSKDLAWRLYVHHDDDHDRETPAVPTDCWDFGHQPEEISLIDSPDPLCRRQD